MYLTALTSNSRGLSEVLFESLYLLIKRPISYTWSPLERNADRRCWERPLSMLPWASKTPVYMRKLVSPDLWSPLFSDVLPCLRMKGIVAFVQLCSILKHSTERAIPSVGFITGGNSVCWEESHQFISYTLFLQETQHN